MIEFPEIPAKPDFTVRKMTLREYALFSERCLRSNSHITPENCLRRRASEKDMPQPFSLRTK